MDELNDKQRAFVFEYIQDYNAVRAARAVGYKNPKASGCRLLDPKYHPKVCRAIGAIQRKNLETAILTEQEILEELSVLASRDIIELCDENGVFNTNDLTKIPASIRRCIDGLEIKQDYDKHGEVIGQTIKVKLVAKLGAIEMLAKHYGMFAPQKVEHSVQPTLDWDELYEKAGESDQLDVIEGKIANAGRPVQEELETPKKPKKFKKKFKKRKKDV